MQSIDVSEIERHGDPSTVYTSFESDESCLVSLGEKYIFFGTSTGRILSLRYSSKQVHRKLKAEDISKENKHSAEITTLKLIANVAPSSSSSTSNPNYLASGSSDRTIRIWSVAEGIFVQKLFGHDGLISDIQDGFDASIISCSIDGCFKVWTLGQGRSLLKYAFYECTFSHKYGMHSWLQAIAVKHTGVWSLYVGDADGGIEVWRKGTEAQNQGSGRLVQVSTDFHRAKVWSGMHKLRISHIFVCQNEGNLVTLSYDCFCKISNATTGQQLLAIENARTCMYTNVFFTAVELCFTLVDELGYLEQLSLLREAVVSSVQLVSVSQHQFAAISKSHQNQAIRKIKPYSREGSFLAHLPAEGVVCHMELHREFRYKTFRGEENSIVSVYALPFSVSMDRKRILRDRQLSTITATSRKGTSAIQISREESLMLVVDTMSITAFDEEDCREVFQIRNKQRAEISSSCILWHINSIVTAHEDGNVCLVNLDSSSKTLVRALDEPLSSLCLAVYKKSDVLIVASFDGSIAILSVSSLRDNPFALPCEAVYKGHHDVEDPGILCLAFHKPTNLLFSGGNDATIRVWHVGNATWTATGKDVYTCDFGHEEAVCTLLCPDDQRADVLLSVDIAGVIVLWRILTTEGEVALLQLACWSTTYASLATVLVDASVSYEADGKLSVYIARTERNVDVKGKIDVSETQITRKVEDSVVNFLEEAAKKYTREVVGYACRIAESAEFSVTTRRLCELSYEDFVDGEPTYLNLLSVDKTSSPSTAEAKDAEGEAKISRRDSNDEFNDKMPPPTLLYLARSTGTVYRFEI